MGGALLVAWLMLWNKLRIDWSYNEQYAYGWFVPPLAVALLALRWRDRPSPTAFTGEPGMRSRWPTVIAAGTCLALLFPVRLIEESAGNWRLLLWLHAALLVTFSLLLARWSGGRPWVRHFAFPVFFLLLAVPWPSDFEGALVQGLMRAVAAIAAEIMNLLGIPAIQEGNLIRVRSQMVGVSEACSGIRSLQTVVMAALFLGELSRLPWTRRLTLLAGGIGVAMVANVFRSSLLVWIAANYGAERLEHYHDAAGLSVLVIVFAGLLAINGWLERHIGRRATRTREVEKETGTKEGEQETEIAPLPPVRLARARPVPVGFAVSALAWLTFCEIGTAAWYRVHEWGTVPPPSWTVAMPGNAPGFKELPIEKFVRDLLNYDTATNARWKCLGEPQNTECTLFFFRWGPGNMAAGNAAGHTPTTCLPAHGWTQVADRGVTACVTNSGITLSVQEYEFQTKGQPIYVYYSVWHEQSGKWTMDYNTPRFDRVSGALRGQRNRYLGQQTLECVITGPSNAEEARAVFNSQMNEVIQRHG